MKNKFELKKTIVISIITIFVFLIVFLCINCYEYNYYMKNFNNAINSIVAKVIEENPNIDINEIVRILSDGQNKKENLLYVYGIDLNRDSVIIDNENKFNKISLVNIILVIVLGTSIAGIFLLYNKSKNKKIDEITKYIEEINNGNYKLYIEDNTEDELSILKNEIYKTTVMLKEVAENSKKDKINLKDSLSDISHQLKTPLTSIVIMLDNIQDNPNMDVNMRNDFLSDIKREIININFLVVSLLKLSKLDSSTVKFINKDEYICDIIGESVKNVSAICDLKNVEVKVLGNNNAMINCDLKWQVEAITNILKNCVEHSNQNSSIDIKFEKSKTYSKIEIVDYGVGIDERDLPHIFERFYKGRNSSSDSIGIGLALAKSIIEKSNGYINVESKIEHGSKFIIKYFN